MRKFIVSILSFFISWWFPSYCDRRTTISVFRIIRIFMFYAFLLSIIASVLVWYYLRKTDWVTYAIIFGAFQVVAILLGAFFGRDCANKILGKMSKCKTCQKTMAIEKSGDELVTKTNAKKKSYNGKKTEYHTYHVSLRRAYYTCRFCNDGFSYEYTTQTRLL